MIASGGRKSGDKRQRRLRDAYEREDPAARALYSSMGKWANGITGTFFGIASLVMLVLMLAAEPGQRSQFAWPLLLSLIFVGLSVYGFFLGRLQGPRT